jgi:hypothetical protein
VDNSLYVMGDVGDAADARVEGEVFEDGELVHGCENVLVDFRDGGGRMGV